MSAAARWHAPDEPIATPRDGLDERRVVRIVAERSAQAFDGGVQAVLEVDERAVGPETLPQLVARDDVAGPLEHQPENLERLLLQTHARAPLRSSRERTSSSKDPKRKMRGGMTSDPWLPIPDS